MFGYNSGMNGRPDITEMIDLITIEDARRLRQQAQDLIDHGHDPADLTIEFDVIRQERTVILRHRAHPTLQSYPVRPARARELQVA